MDNEAKLEPIKGPKDRKTMEIHNDAQADWEQQLAPLAEAKPALVEGPVGSKQTEAQLRDTVSETGERSRPTRFIEDHFFQLAPGINPATCEVCQNPPQLHSQFNPTHQDPSPAQEDAQPDEGFQLAAHMVEAHGYPDLGSLDPEEDGLILDRLWSLHEASHQLISEKVDMTQTNPDWKADATDHQVHIIKAPTASGRNGYVAACVTCNTHVGQATDDYRSARWDGEEHITSKRRQLPIMATKQASEAEEEMWADIQKQDRPRIVESKRCPGCGDPIDFEQEKCGECESK